MRDRTLHIVKRSGGERRRDLAESRSAEKRGKEVPCVAMSCSRGPGDTYKKPAIDSLSAVRGWVVVLDRDSCALLPVKVRELLPLLSITPSGLSA
jgi:hypothetical protein